MKKDIKSEHEESAGKKKAPPSGEKKSSADEEAGGLESVADEDIIRPYEGPKIGEASGNLQQREEWFQRRTGNRK
ncbi:MAG: hypothetical protein WCD76_16980 [Pyrinomonadaceae bacterium]